MNFYDPSWCFTFNEAVNSWMFEETGESGEKTTEILMKKLKLNFPCTLQLVKS